jgi:hypothetical protein
MARSPAAAAGAGAGLPAGGPRQHHDASAVGPGLSLPRRRLASLRRRSQPGCQSRCCRGARAARPGPAGSGGPPGPPAGGRASVVARDRDRAVTVTGSLSLSDLHLEGWFMLYDTPPCYITGCYIVFYVINTLVMLYNTSWGVI